MGNMTATERARFESKYEIQGDCHTWQGPLDRDGYGTFHFRGAPRRAHRVAWYDAFGEIEDGYVVNHTCRNRGCVNPQHLQSITARENTHRDSSSRPYINSQKTMCPEGHAYDKTETSSGRTYRVCSVCRREKQRVAKRRRYAEAKALRV